MRAECGDDHELVVKAVASTAPVIEVSGRVEDDFWEEVSLARSWTTLVESARGAVTTWGDWDAAVNRPGFDAASFLAKDADHGEEVSHRAAGARDPDGG